MNRVKKQKIVCIRCPFGCRGTVATHEVKGKVTSEGYDCKEGRKYAEAEARESLRVLTATVITESTMRPLLSVRSSSPIPKHTLQECMRLLATIRVKPPIRPGELIVFNILHTGANIVATAELLG